jgi:1,4-dihydroxy-2-naphthoate octaprenyltransferase
MRFPFITATIVPILIGFSAGFAAVGTFNLALFILAIAAIVCLNLGSNMANEYFDHLSGNDWLNKNRGPFSGGTGLIQAGFTSPKAVLIGAWVAFALGAMVGIAILLISRSRFILTLGLIGLGSGYFYSANPIKLGYRGAGEVVIGLVCGLGPVYGAYFLQTRSIDLVPLGPAVIISLLVFLIILINEFPDAEADAAVNKKTLVVLLGAETALQIYRTALIFTYVVAIVTAMGFEEMRWAGFLYLLTIPLAAAILRFLKQDTLGGSGNYRVNKLTILLHLVGGLLMCLGFIITRALM